MTKTHFVLPAMIVGLLLAGCSDDNGAGPLPIGDATYKVTFDATWSAATHPTDFPGNAHWSSLIGGTHDATVSFWADGVLATTGVKNMAELGAPAKLKEEVEAVMGGTGSEYVLQGGGIPSSPGAVSLEFAITEEYPLVTLVSMLAPSPDWFIGVHGLSLIDDGQWVDSLTVELFLYDAGTDDGTNYTSENAVTDPPQPIMKMTGFPALVEGEIRSFGTYTFIRQDMP